MNEPSYTVFYEVPGNVRPRLHQEITETAEIDSIRFAAKYPGARIRRDSDNAWYDYRSGQWVKIGA